MLDPRFTFQRFVSGSGNRVAAEAARRVAEAPGRTYNPLLVVGPPGSGRSHLLHAIGHLAVSLDPDLAVHYESVQSLADRVTAGVAAGDLASLRAAFGNLDLLLIDDLDEIEGFGRTQRELAGICEAMLARGRQVVFASTQPSNRLSGLDADLTAVLAEGMAVDLPPPDEETRLGIVRQLGEEAGAPLPAPVAIALARADVEEAGALESATRTLLQAACEERRAPTIDDARRALRSLETTRTDEFATFLFELDVALASVVETAPWRRRLARAILRWEAEGVRTRRLEVALDTDTPPDVDTLIEGFERDAARLLELRPRLDGHADPSLLDDPDRLPEVEALLRPAEPEAPPPKRVANGGEAMVIDHWFLDRAVAALDWVGADGRLEEAD